MKLDCRTVQRLAGDFAEDSLNDRDLSLVLSHIKTCGSCYEELKTAYLISYAIEYMDDDRSGALDIDALMKEKIKKCETKLRIHTVLGLFLWISIIVLAVIIVSLVIRIISPDLIPFVTDFYDRILGMLSGFMGG